MVMPPILQLSRDNGDMECPRGGMIYMSADILLCVKGQFSSFAYPGTFNE